MQQLSLEDLKLPNQEGIVMCFRTMHKSCEKVSGWSGYFCSSEVQKTW